jgi:hypothetical protein
MGERTLKRLVEEFRSCTSTECIKLALSAVSAARGRTIPAL